MKNSTSDQAWARFNSWFNRHGHWIYSSREKAIKTWMERGIDGLPNYPK